MAHLVSNNQTLAVQHLVDELFANVLYDEEPFFISDEATLWAVSMSDTHEILERIRSYYKVPIAMSDTKQPLWQLLIFLEERRSPQR